ncbi:unnamed protein product, partial [Cyprideis torosa]
MSTFPTSTTNDDEIIALPYHEELFKRHSSTKSAPHTSKSHIFASTCLDTYETHVQCQLRNLKGYLHLRLHHVGSQLLHREEEHEMELRSINGRSLSARNQ